MERNHGFRKFGHLPRFKLINTPIEIAAHILNELNFLNEKKTNTTRTAKLYSRPAQASLDTVTTTNGNRRGVRNQLISTQGLSIVETSLGA